MKSNVSLKEYNSYGIGGMAKYLVEPTSVSELISVLNELDQKKIPWVVLGGGSNVLIPDEDFNGAIVKVSIMDFKIDGEALEVGSGVYLNSMINTLIESGYTNLCPLYGIPGTVGGALVGNAGANGMCIYDDLVELTVVDKDKKVITYKREDITYGYRDTQFKKTKDIIVKAVFNIRKGNKDDARNIILKNTSERRKKQPLEYKNAGSVFKNPSGASAGALIEECGLKGLRVGDAEVSNKHANFIINKGNATSKDICNLIDKIKKEVKSKKNVDLELEQIVLKW